MESEDWEHDEQLFRFEDIVEIESAFAYVEHEHTRATEHYRRFPFNWEVDARDFFD